MHNLALSLGLKPVVSHAYSAILKDYNGMIFSTSRSLLSIVLLSAVVSACNSSDEGSDTAIDNQAGELDPDYFESAALVEAISTVDCTLSSGIETTCYSITVTGVPANREVGPFCPTTINASAEESGIWFDGGAGGDAYVHDLDGNFIANLANRYGDNNWQLYDAATGDVRYTNTLEGCEAAARPDVDPAYQNYCVQCSLDYVDGGVEQAFLIPVNPVPLDTPAALSGDVGVTLDGVRLALPAPVADILANYTIAAFDDCGGHINPVAGYHYHGATACTEFVQPEDGRAALLGYARDGYGIYAMADAGGNEHSDLDTCRGATDDVRGYHYHAASAGENMFIGCFHGDTVAVENGGGPPGGGPPPE